MQNHAETALISKLLQDIFFKISLRNLFYKRKTYNISSILQLWKDFEKKEFATFKNSEVSEWDLRHFHESFTISEENVKFKHFHQFIKKYWGIT